MDDLADRGTHVGGDRGDDRLLAALGVDLDQVDAPLRGEDRAQGVQEEDSRFLRESGRWYYVDGETV